jgi:hypothetical protein
MKPGNIVRSTYANTSGKIMLIVKVRSHHNKKTDNTYAILVLFPLTNERSDDNAKFAEYSLYYVRKMI